MKAIIVRRCSECPYEAPHFTTSATLPKCGKTGMILSRCGGEIPSNCPLEDIDQTTERDEEH